MWWCFIIFQNEISRPDIVSIDEDVVYKFKIENLIKHYDEVFGKGQEPGRVFTRWIFQIILQSNQNTVLILAGSLASIPVNILTGFYGSSSYTCIDWTLHILQLISSILFYVSYLSFVRLLLYIREQGEKYANNIYVTSPHNSRKAIEKAVNNIQYFFCMEKYKNVRTSICCVLMFGIILVLLLLIPPDFFSKVVYSCAVNIKNSFGGTNVDTLYEQN